MQIASIFTFKTEINVSFYEDECWSRAPLCQLSVQSVICEWRNVKAIKLYPGTSGGRNLLFYHRSELRWWQVNSGRGGQQPISPAGSPGWSPAGEPVCLTCCSPLKPSQVKSGWRQCSQWGGAVTRGCPALASVHWDNSSCLLHICTDQYPSLKLFKKDKNIWKLSWCVCCAL